MSVQIEGIHALAYCSHFPKTLCIVHINWKLTKLLQGSSFLVNGDILLGKSLPEHIHLSYK